MTNSTNRDQRIADLAHKIWEEEGQPEGQAQAHWARAVAILDDEAAPKKPAAKTAPKAKAAPKKK